LTDTCAGTTQVFTYLETNGNTKISSKQCLNKQPKTYLQLMKYIFLKFAVTDAQNHQSVTAGMHDFQDSDFFSHRYRGK